MTSFVSGYCAVRSLVPANDDDNDGDRGTEGNRQKGVRSKLHFTRCGISQIHERRTVSGALVKPRGISIGITLSLSLSLSLSPSPSPLLAHSFRRCTAFGRSFSVPRTASRRFIPTKLSTPSRAGRRVARARARGVEGGGGWGNIRFRRVRASRAVY